MVDGEMEFRPRSPDMATAMLLSLILAAVLTVGLVFVFPHGAETIRTAEYWRRVARDPQIYLITAACIWLPLWAQLRSRYERLYVGPKVLRYISPFGGSFRFLQRVQPDWSIPWSELQRSELQVQSLGLGKRRYSLVLQTASGQRVLEAPLYWQRVPFSFGPMAKPPRRNEAQMRRAIMNSPLVQALRAHGVEVTEVAGLVRPKGALKGYDIAQDKRLLVAVGLLLVALVYYYGDTFIDWPYMPLENVPVWPYAVVGFLGLWLGYDLGKKAPRMERVLVSIMLAGSLCAACYPLMLRLNALTAGADDHIYRYTQVRPGYFKPPEAGLPYIYFEGQAYWSMFPNGNTYEFRLLKGALGFYEVDTGQVQDEIHAWGLTHPPKGS